MTDSVKIEPHGGAVGLFRLLFWNYHFKRYEFPPFSEFMRLRFGDTALRPHSLVVCQRLRFVFLTFQLKLWLLSHLIRFDRLTERSVVKLSICLSNYFAGVCCPRLLIRIHAEPTK